ASTLGNLGDVLYQQGDLPGAQKKCEEALTIQNEIGEKGRAAETRIALATVLIEEGQVARAETLAREAAEEFQIEKVNVDEAFSRAVLAWSLVAQGKLAEALKVVDTATKLLAKSDNREKRLPAFIIAARVRAASGETV